MGRLIVVVGDATSGGGRVITGSAFTNIDGRAVALLTETDRSYTYASHALGITKVPVLVAWTKTDVGSGGELSRRSEVDIAMRHAKDPNIMAVDLLGSLVALHRWPKGDA